MTSESRGRNAVELDPLLADALHQLQAGKARLLLCDGRNGVTGQYNMAVATGEGDTVVILSERDDNPGASVTNSYADLAMAVLLQELVGADQNQARSDIRWFEHYPRQPGGWRKETLDVVTLPWNPQHGRFGAPS